MSSVKSSGGRRVSFGDQITSSSDILSPILQTSTPSNRSSNASDNGMDNSFNAEVDNDFQIDDDQPDEYQPEEVEEVEIFLPISLSTIIYL